MGARWALTYSPLMVGADCENACGAVRNPWRSTRGATEGSESNVVRSHAGRTMGIFEKLGENDRLIEVATKEWLGARFEALEQPFDPLQAVRFG